MALIQLWQARIADMERSTDRNWQSEATEIRRCIVELMGVLDTLRA